MHQPDRPPALDVNSDDPRAKTALRFWDSPGIPALWELPINRCPTCTGFGVMGDVKCPDCNGIGGTPAHCSRVALDLIDHLEMQLHSEAVKAKLSELVTLLQANTKTTDVPPGVMPLSIDPRAYVNEHGVCFLHALVLATRMLVYKWAPPDHEDPLISRLGRMLAGDWDDVEIG